MQSSRLQETINLFEKYLKTENTSLLDEAIKIGTKLCTSPIFSATEKMTAFKGLIKYDNIKGAAGFCSDILSIWRDSTMFLKNIQLDETLSLLREVVRCSDLSSHSRIYTAVHLYNSGHLEVCYCCLADLANDKTLEVDHRLESLRFLFASGEDEERNIVRDIMLEIIADKNIPCDVRYKAIAAFIPNTGIKVLMNFSKLKVPYEEDFVYILQTAFFNDKFNDIRFRILSGQHLLQLPNNITTQNIKEDIITLFFEIANDTTSTENVRADAADVILRLGSQPDKIKARNLIHNLGFLNDGSKRKTIVPETIYSNSQNIHDETIDKSVQIYLEKLFDIDCGISIKSFQDVEIEISSCLRRIFPVSAETITDVSDGGIVTILNSEEINRKRNDAYNALSRISVDTATFTSHNITTAEVLIKVWLRIHSGEFDKTTINLLEEMVVDELVNMSDTCSSGYAGRFVNVFSIVDESLKISWFDQIKANVHGRMSYAMRNCVEDVSLQESIAFGIMENAEEKDRAIYLQFVSDNLKIIYKNLYEEFVVVGHVKSDEFDNFMENIKNEWISL
jgi:uncharacterized protein (UPF0147 family)